MHTVFFYSALTPPVSFVIKSDGGHLRCPDLLCAPFSDTRAPTRVTRGSLFLGVFVWFFFFENFSLILRDKSLLHRGCGPRRFCMSDSRRAREFHPLSFFFPRPFFLLRVHHSRAWTRVPSPDRNSFYQFFLKGFVPSQVALLVRFPLLPLRFHRSQIAGNRVRCSFLSSAILTFLFPSAPQVPIEQQEVFFLPRSNPFSLLFDPILFKSRISPFPPNLEQTGFPRRFPLALFPWFIDSPGSRYPNFKRDLSPARPRFLPPYCLFPPLLSPPPSSPHSIPLLFFLRFLFVFSIRIFSIGAWGKSLPLLGTYFPLPFPSLWLQGWLSF